MEEIILFERFITCKYNQGKLKPEEKALIQNSIDEFITKEFVKLGDGVKC